MLFSTALFLLLFLPLFFALYWGARERALVLLLGSTLFYTWGEPVWVVVVLAAATLDWHVARCMTRSHRRLEWLTVGVCFNLGLLVYAKYTMFAVTNLNRVRGAAGLSPWTVPEIALPLGISFFVFEEITYLVDIYRGDAVPAPRLRSYLNYILLFPKMLAGPIIKYKEIGNQLEDLSPTPAQVRDGLLRFLTGLAKKVILADSFAPVCDQIFSLGPHQLDAPSAWWGLVCFSLQIYWDFSGYTDMAIGMGAMMGLRLPENFRNPYWATSATDFWRRWHISLSTWIRDYLYIPLGGNRRGRLRGYLNLVLCILLSGLWHGATWTFVVWGLLFGFGLVFDRLIWLEAVARLPAWVSRLLFLVFLHVSWIPFRSLSLEQAWSYLVTLLGGDVQLGPTPVVHEPDTVFLALISLVLIVRGTREPAEPSPEPRPWAVLGGLLLLVLSLAQIMVNGYRPFLYFRF